MFTKKVMQFHSKQIGTPPGDHNKPGGPANNERIHNVQYVTIHRHNILTEWLCTICHSSKHGDLLRS